MSRSSKTRSTMCAVAASSLFTAYTAAKLASRGRRARSSVMKSPFLALSQRPTSCKSFVNFELGLAVLTQSSPNAIDYLDSGKVKVKGIVNKTFKIEEWEQCLESMKNKSAIKAAIVFD